MKWIGIILLFALCLWGKDSDHTVLQKIITTDKIKNFKLV
ncbi:hypothetical protein MNB_SM-7-1532 [hydrothermal vent metagenome]|uniref:Uncharacterized protein n=1 Tax=hydrothermal vent metagenome TaxID=652676 RepID=A0A1W1B989_9ZZZZ